MILEPQERIRFLLKLIVLVALALQVGGEARVVLLLPLPKRVGALEHCVVASRQGALAVRPVQRLQVIVRVRLHGAKEGICAIHATVPLEDRCTLVELARQLAALLTLGFVLVGR